ncbi:fluoride efflux transporter CrcB [Thermovibrio sp.]
MNTLLWIGAGGFLGAISRFLIAGIVQKHFPLPFPAGTLAVNALGSFLIGFLALFFENLIAPQYKAMVITGFLGALTTFSTFSYETSMLLIEGAYLRALLNVVLNVILCLGATFSGMWLFKSLFKV